MKTSITLLVALVVAVSGCYAPGERNQGESGYAAVPYRACCDGQQNVKKPGEWGRFCPPKVDGGSEEDTCYGPGERNEGAAGKPAVPFKPCCDGQASVEKAKEWGKFCPEKDTATCYKAGERNQGEKGKPAVPYKPCCNGKKAVEKDGDWGKFCLADGTTTDATVPPVSTTTDATVPPVGTTTDVTIPPVDTPADGCSRRRRRRRRRL